MNFSEDFVCIQGIFISAKAKVGDFLSIKYRGGNEQKIATVVDRLRCYLVEQKYLRKGKINPKYEDKLREINLFLILNTEFNNKNILAGDNKFVHLIDVMPQISKCLLANIVWSLDLCRFYSEAIYSLPIELSVELLENCNSCLKKQEPYLVLEQVAMVALAIYVKLYNVRNENIDNEKVSALITKLLEKFTEVLQNYITPEVERMSFWEPLEMYQYMGVAINKILHVLKCCFNIFLNNNIGEMHEIYQVNTQGVGQTPEKLDRSAQALKKCNICLMSVCEANLEAVTVDVFCSWAEYKHNNAKMQQVIGNLAFEVRQLLDNFEGCGNLPSMLDQIKQKPKTIEELIGEADEETLLRNVAIADSKQPLWFKALLKHGILKSTETYSAFKNHSYLITKEDYLYLLNYSVPFIKDNQELKHYILDNICKIGDWNAIEIIAEYYQNTSVNNLYETETFETQLSELFNKLCKEKSIFCAGNVTKHEITNLVLQNPSKFIAQLLLESIKNIDHLSNILKIIEYVKPICNIKDKGSSYTLFTNIFTTFLKEYEFEGNALQCLTILINSLVTSDILKQDLFMDLLATVDDSMQRKELQRSVLLLKIMQDLPASVLKNSNSPIVLLKLVDILTKVRWNFVTYENDRVNMVLEIISLIKKCKTYPKSGDVNIDTIKGNEINVFYLSEQSDFLPTVSPDYNRNASHEEQICRLLKLLPNCCPSEWIEIRNYLLKDSSPWNVFELIVDVILILTEMFKKPEYLKCLSYCFQQFCIHVKNDVHPFVVENKGNFPHFIKTICRVIKHLPLELQNNYELSLVNLFEEDVLKSMADDQEFICLLLSISDLEICKIICTKMVTQ